MNKEKSDLRAGLTDARITWGFGFGLCFMRQRHVQDHPSNHKIIHGTKNASIHWPVGDCLQAETAQNTPGTHADGNFVPMRSRTTGTSVALFFGADGQTRSFGNTTLNIQELKGGKTVRAYHAEDWSTALRQLSGKQPARFTNAPPPQDIGQIVAEARAFLKGDILSGLRVARDRTAALQRIRTTTFGAAICLS